MKTHLCRQRLFILLSALNVILLSPDSVKSGGTAVDYALCDIHVAAIFEDPGNVDWPTLYYLNDNFGCRIDLIQIQTRASFTKDNASIPAKEIYLHSYGIPPDFKYAIDSLNNGPLLNRMPDILIFFDLTNEKLKSELISSANKWSADTTNVFGATSVYEYKKTNQGISSPIIINSQELLKQFSERIRNEISLLIESFEFETYKAERLVYYASVTSDGSPKTQSSNFIGERNNYRLTEIADSKISSGPARKFFVDRAKKYQSTMNASKSRSGKERTTLIIEAYRSLLDLNEHPSFVQVAKGVDGLESYLNELFSQAERAALEAVGLKWEGRIIIRDTPQGPSVKYRATVLVDGPTEVSLNRIMFYPYWDSAKVVLDSTAHTIAPHQSYVREYFIDIDQQYLESNEPESLSFSSVITYSNIPLRVTDKLPLWETPDLKIRFVPDFYFLPPVARLEVDRVVESMTWKVAITKPHDFTGKVKLHLETPKGMFAGAYKQELDLEPGISRQIVRVPFTVSKLFELGIQEATATLSMNNRVIAADTSKVRIAECKIADTLKVGFLSDTTGMLEDILSMTNAGFQPITDRTLMVGNLSAYDIIVIGSGAFKNFTSFTKVRDRFEDYLRNGGSIVVLGQPHTWPLNSLPASIVPSTELVTKEEITNRINGARILSRPYKITETNLLSSFFKQSEVASAVVTPAERVYITPGGSTLLSVSRLGSGQIIYCGLPLLEMVSKLNIEAIHLFANILNY